MNELNPNHFPLSLQRDAADRAERAVRARARRERRDHGVHLHRRLLQRARRADLHRRQEDAQALQSEEDDRATETPSEWGRSRR